MCGAMQISVSYTVNNNLPKIEDLVSIGTKVMFFCILSGKHVPLLGKKLQTHSCLDLGTTLTIIW